MRRDDWLLHQLPVGMTEDDFLVRFVTIFQRVADTVVDQVDGVEHAFDPTVAPTTWSDLWRNGLVSTGSIHRSMFGCSERS
jgi:hypothetical protein